MRACCLVWHGAPSIVDDLAARTQMGVLETIGVLESKAKHSVHPDMAEPNNSEDQA